ncbi:MAG: antibiotic biosynthesis monooxygenase family protein [Acidimicrobiales bacterium]
MTPQPPYVAVIFTSRRNDDDEGYAEMSAAMEELAALQPGYLGVDSVTDGERGITVSYWRTTDDALAWKRNADHAVAQRLGRERWYSSYDVRVATVERQYRHP